MQATVLEKVCLATKRTEVLEALRGFVLILKIQDLLKKKNTDPKYFWLYSWSGRWFIFLQAIPSGPH